MRNLWLRILVSFALVAATVGLIAATALAGTAPVGPTPTPSGSEGIRGHVWVGPVSPVQKDGEDNEKAYAGAKVLVKTKDGRTVATFVSGADGSFEVALAPGTYVLDPQSPDGSPLPRAGTLTVTVVAAVFTVVDIHYDSGIR